MAELDPDRILALSYIGAARRPAVEALWRLDAALGAVLASGREPMISRIKLAWWREALERLGRERNRGEPVLDALAAHVLPAGLSGEALAAMEGGWAVLLSPDPLTEADLATYARERGARLFDLTARLLDGGAAPAGGEVWALTDFARRSASEEEAEMALRLAATFPANSRVRAPLRPLGMLAALARRDLERGGRPWEAPGSPGRMLRMLGHRLIGL